MQKVCQISGVPFKITQEDVQFYKMMGVPEPSLCPPERQRRRLLWQNMSHLYHRNCDATGKKVISNFSEDKKYVVYEQGYWWSDSWNPFDYGKDFNFTQSFFEQFDALMHTVPMPCLFTEYTKDENSAFTNFAGYNKNCYLIFHADFNEDCYFATGLKNSKNAVDSLNVFDVEQSYECVDCKDCFNIKYCQDCYTCSDSWFLRNCVGCKNCFGSMNLENKEYFLFNKKVEKTTYDDFINNFESGKYSIQNTLYRKFIDFQKTQIHRATYTLRNENSHGDHIFDCKNVNECFDVKESKNMKFCERIYNGPNLDCYDVDQFGVRIERIYESANIGVDCQNSIACLYGYNFINCLYCLFCFNCEDCFGCVGLKQVKYCIFNKQYTKEEYFKLKKEIIEHMMKPHSNPLLTTGEGEIEWGEFFPSSLSPFGYNETVANEYYPLSKEEALTKNFKWKDDESNRTYNEPHYEIPDNILDIGEDILQKILTCDQCTKHYRIVGPELEFYKRYRLPLPRKCPNCRHLDRLSLRNPRKMYTRHCDKCQKEIQTTYAPERPERVYCEECYNKEVY